MIWVLILILHTGGGGMVNLGEQEHRTLEECQKAADEALEKAADARIAAVCIEVPVEMKGGV